MKTVVQSGRLVINQLYTTLCTRSVAMGNCKSSPTVSSNNSNNSVAKTCEQPSQDPKVSNSANQHEQINKGEGNAVLKSSKPVEEEKPIAPFVPSDPGASVEAVVCNFDDLKDGEMREVEVGKKGKALLVRENGEYSAVGAKCTHYGAPLVKGALYNGRVRCPWHGACFNVKTGDIEDFPGLDSLPKFDVEVRGAKVVVKTTEKNLESHKRVKHMACGSPDVETTVLIIGGGGSAIACAETLRQEGFKGKVIMATKENCPPYDRPKLSKALTSTGVDLALRKPEFFLIYDIDIETGKEAISVDTMLKSVSFTDGDTINYDTLVIATGGRPRSLGVSGSDIPEVLLLRSPDDANKIASLSKGKNAVIVGNSFIGMEVAAYLVGKAKSVTLVGRSEVPFQAVLGQKIGDSLKKMSEEKGVKFVGGASVEKCIGSDGHLTEVVLNNGNTISADICIVGAGVTPATDFLRNSGIDLTRNGLVEVNQFMKSSKDNVFACGDVTHFPLFLNGGDKVNIGHWQMAHAQGRIAALNIMEQDTEIQSVPFFWTQMHGKSLRYCGYGAGHDDIVIHGQPDDLNFIAFYIKDNCVKAAASMNMDPLVSQIAEVMASGNTITKDEILEDPKGFQHRLL